MLRHRRPSRVTMLRQYNRLADRILKGYSVGSACWVVSTKETDHDRNQFRCLALE